MFQNFAKIVGSRARLYTCSISTQMEYGKRRISNHVGESLD
jgi:hypothetical protein